LPKIPAFPVESIPSPFPKGRGRGGVSLPEIPENPSPPSWEHPLPFPKRPLKKYRQIIDLLHDGYIQT